MGTFKDDFYKTIDHWASQLPGIAGWKKLGTSEQGFLSACANQLTTNLCGFKYPEEMIGLSDYDLKGIKNIEEHAPIFFEQDRLAVHKDKEIKCISILEYADQQPMVILGVKSPLKDTNDQVIGVLYICIPMLDRITTQMSPALIKSTERYNTANFKKYHYFLDGNYTCDNRNLSKREQECLFFILRGGTCKSIAKRLSLSYRTVESYVDHLKCKFDCTSKSQLIEAAFHEGYIYFIPESLI